MKWAPPPTRETRSDRQVPPSAVKVKLDFNGTRRGPCLGPLNVSQRSLSRGLRDSDPARASRPCRGHSPTSAQVTRKRLARPLRRLRRRRRGRRDVMGRRRRSASRAAWQLAALRCKRLERAVGSRSRGLLRGHEQRGRRRDREVSLARASPRHVSASHARGSLEEAAVTRLLFRPRPGLSRRWPGNDKRSNDPPHLGISGEGLGSRDSRLEPTVTISFLGTSAFAFLLFSFPRWLFVASRIVVGQRGAEQGRETRGGRWKSVLWTLNIRGCRYYKPKVFWLSYAILIAYHT